MRDLSSARLKEIDDRLLLRREIVRSRLEDDEAIVAHADCVFQLVGNRDDSRVAEPCERASAALVFFEQRRHGDLAFADLSEDGKIGFEDLPGTERRRDRLVRSYIHD